jgi:hypothetical protein
MLATVAARSDNNSDNSLGESADARRALTKGCHRSQTPFIVAAFEWIVPLALAVVFVALNGMVLASGVYQVITGNPSLLVRIVASIRSRLPATPNDCILQGAGQVLQSVGLFVGLGPVILPAVASASELFGAPQLPPLAHWPGLVFVALAYALVSLIIAIVCLGVSLALSLRVRYVTDEGTIKAAG